MKLFVAGAAGFLGSHFLKVALEEGHQVTGLRRSGDSRPRIELPCEPIWLEKLLEEVTSADIEGHDVLVHLAAAGVKASNRSWQEALEINVLGTLRLFEVARTCRGRAPAFLMARTFYEDLVSQLPALLENPYIASKQIGYKVVLMRAVDYPASLGFVRVFQVYGPGDDPGNVLSYAARQFALGKKAYFGSGRTKRDWIRVTDAARGLLAAVFAIRNKAPATINEFDLGGGELHSIRDMVERLAGIAGVDCKAACEFDPAVDRTGDHLALAASRPLPGDWKSGSPEIGLRELWEFQLKTAHFS